MHHAVDPDWGLNLPSPFHPDNPYKLHIELGLNWLFMNATIITEIVPQPAGDPDSDGDDFVQCLPGAGQIESQINMTRKEKDDD